MAFESKYIIADIVGNPTPIVFPDLLVHAEVASAFGVNRSGVSGAGFCTIDDSGYRCYGKSVSLKVDSNYDADSKILNRRLGVTTE